MIRPGPPGDIGELVTLLAGLAMAVAGALWLAGPWVLVGAGVVLVAVSVDWRTHAESDESTAPARRR